MASNYVVSSGVTSSGITLSAGDLMTVSSGGKTINISDGGEEELFAGAVASSTTVAARGVLIEGGATEIGTVVDNTGLEQIGGSGTDIDTVVSTGGVQWLYASATASSTTLSGGTQILGGVTSSIPFGVQSTTGGTAIGDVVDAGGHEYVGTGATASGTVVHSGGTQQVGGSTTWSYYYGLSAGSSATMSTNLSGGIASDTVVSSGGAEIVGSGGVTTSTTVISGDVISGSGGLVVESGGSAIATVASGGETVGISILVSSGGATTGTVLSTADETVYSGGVASQTTVSSGGQLYLNSGSSGGSIAGGSAFDTTVLSGGHEQVLDYAIESGGTVDNGGLIGVAGTIVGETVQFGGSAFMLVDGNGAHGSSISGIIYGSQTASSGGFAIGDTVMSGGQEWIVAGGSATNIIVSSGGQLVVSGIAGSGAVSDGATVLSGGTDIVSAGGAATSTTIANGGTLIVSSGATTSDTILQMGGTIDVAYVPYVSGATAALNSSTDVLTVTDGGNTLTYQMADSYAGDTFYVTKDSTNQTQITLTPCFCTGTRILTDRGEVPVEQLAVGDRVKTADGTPRPVKWIGHRNLDLSRHPDPELVWPVLVQAGAMGDNAPHRDLYVSPDHALLLDGLLVPARLLVNGASIQTVCTRKTVTYHHVELETHDILLAENLPAESYLDTGNRGMFENGGAAMILHPDLTNDQSRRVGRSCRPFADEPAVVEPIWHRLAQRSVGLGLPPRAAIRRTDDPGLRVVIDSRTIRPLSRQGGRYVFMLPATDAPIQLLSHAARPCSLRPWVEDRRRLGVMVSGLTLKQGADVNVIPLDHPSLSRGWWDAESDQSTQWRWTDGAATIPVTPGAPALLEVTVAHTMDYPVAAGIAGLTAA
jgi:autotransporter passenger strand-loop-strand repeat protein